MTRQAGGYTCEEAYRLLATATPGAGGLSRIIADGVAWEWHDDGSGACLASISSAGGPVLRHAEWPAPCRLRALSIRQPWAWAILTQGKYVENRDWRYVPRYRGPLLLHAIRWWRAGEAGRILQDLLDRDLIDDPSELRFHLGGIVGIVTVDDARRVPETGGTTDWEVPGAVGLYLSEPESFQDPLPCRGHLGFFEPCDLSPKGLAECAEAWGRRLLKMKDFNIKTAICQA